MKRTTRLILTSVGLIALSIFASFFFFGRKARMACDEAVAAQIAAMPHFSTRFSAQLGRYLSPTHSGFQPGWIVSYASPAGFPSFSLYTDFTGHILASGPPKAVPALMRGHEKLRQETKKLAETVEQMGMIIRPGAHYTNVVASLGPPMSEKRFSNDVLLLNYVFGGGSPEPGQFITNGFTIIFSNQVVTTNMPIMMTR